jgi:hypothetical protein
VGGDFILVPRSVHARKGQYRAADVRYRGFHAPPAEAERQAAEDQAWAYYAEWSKTARTVVRRKDLRIKLGLSTATRSEEPEEPLEPEPPASTPSAPPPVPGPG